MSTGTQVAVPQNLDIPAYLQTQDAAALVAQYNAAAAGGIKVGGFPRISIKGGKFHEHDGETTITYMQPGSNPAVPLMVLESVIIASNPNLSKAYYEGEYKEGEDRAPICSAEDGIIPDAHIGTETGTVKQHATCAGCPQNEWGSKISKFSGKEIKACTDNKRLVILPVADLTYKALAIVVTPGALKDWGKYVKELTARGVSIASVVTNITFDHTASYPRLQFAFARFLTEAEYAKVQQRAKGDDVKAITTIVRTVQKPKPQGGAPATQPGAPATPPATAPAAPAAVPPAQSAPQAPTPPAAGFGAPAPANPPPAQEPVKTPEPEAPKRAKRTKVENDPRIAHLPPALQEAVKAMGIDSPTGQAILATNPAPAVVPSNPVPPPVQPTPAPTPQAGVPDMSAAPTVGFGAAAAVSAPAAGASAAANSLKAQLAARLGVPPQ